MYAQQRVPLRIQPLPSPVRCRQSRSLESRAPLRGRPGVASRDGVDLQIVDASCTERAGGQNKESKVDDVHVSRQRLQVVMVGGRRLLCWSRSRAPASWSAGDGGLAGLGRLLNRPWD